MDDSPENTRPGGPAQSAVGPKPNPPASAGVFCNDDSGSSGSSLDGGESTVPYQSSTEAVRFVGKFRIIKLVGRGAFGEVYQAYDTVLHRYVALKLPRAGTLSPPDESTFLREAKNVSRLQHPGIVPVFDMGRTDECCFIVSEYVEGITLAQEIRGRRLSFREAAVVIAQLAEALDHAHRHGIIHRDLKPSNVLLDQRHESGSSRRSIDRTADVQPLFPRIVDFGLGKRSMADASISLEGHVLGTPSYMSPEQAAGNSHLVDGRSDVYSLGALLYELLVGVVPFRGETLLNQVLFDPPPRLRSIDRTVPRDLEVVCLKCLEKDPRRRYQSAEELAADLQRWLEGLPILARPISWPQRSIRWANRHRTISVMTAVALIASVAAVAAIVLSTQHEREVQYAVLKNRIDQAVPLPEADLRRELQELKESHSQKSKLFKRYLSDQDNPEDGQTVARLAMLPSQPADAARLLQAMLESDLPLFAVLCEELEPHKSGLKPKLLKAAEDDAEPGRQLRALCALAHYGLRHSSETNISGKLAELIVGQEASAAAGWAHQCRVIAPDVEPKLSIVFSDATAPEPSRIAAAHALAELLRESPEKLSTLVASADANQYPPLMNQLRRQSVTPIPHLERQLAELDHQGAAAEEVEARIRRQAVVASTLFAFDSPDLAWQKILGAYDPRLRSYLIQSSRALDVPPEIIAKQLMEASNPDSQYTMILMLGVADGSKFNNELSSKLERWLKRNYQEHPDSGVHCAIEWLLRTWKRDGVLESVVPRLIREGIRPGRQWYHNSLGQCMVIIEKPVTFEMGSPDGEPGHAPNERQHSRTIRRRFAIAATETTRDQLAKSLGKAVDDCENCPAAGITYEQAVEYCHWLSQQDGIFSTPPAITQDDASTSVTVDLTRTDYRIPSEAEWEFACRAGTTTSRFFGSAATGLEEDYVQFSARDGAGAVGLRIPNRLGLFDVYGNVEEWTSGQLGVAYPIEPIEDPDKMTFKEQFYASRRGGSASTRPSHFRSALRVVVTVGIGDEFVDESVGLRIARTLPSSSNEE